MSKRNRKNKKAKSDIRPLNVFLYGIFLRGSLTTTRGWGMQPMHLAKVADAVLMESGPMSVEKRKGSSVWGVVFQTTPQAVVSLDAVEGAPYFYHLIGAESDAGDELYYYRMTSAYPKRYCGHNNLETAVRAAMILGLPCDVDTYVEYKESTAVPIPKGYGIDGQARPLQRFYAPQAAAKPIYGDPHDADWMHEDFTDPHDADWVNSVYETTVVPRSPTEHTRPLPNWMTPVKAEETNDRDFAWGRGKGKYHG